MPSSAHIWSQSTARRALMGKERTHNPSPAAAAILQKGFGKRRVKGAIAAANRRRRSAHRGNPLPALVAIGSSLLGGGLGKRFRAGSNKRAASMAPAIVQSANAGNLTAARGLIERAAHPMNANEKMVWTSALAQLAPRIVQAVHDNADLIPAADQGSPELFAASISASPVMLHDIEEKHAAAAAAAESKASARRSAAAATQARREELLGGVATAGLTALARGGRRRPQRRRRRTPRFY